MKNTKLAQKRIILTALGILGVVSAPAVLADENQYVVQPGDTLSQISEQANVSLADIVSWNQLTNPDLIYPGDVLRFYQTTTTTTTTTETTPVAAPQPVAANTSAYGSGLSLEQYEILCQVVQQEAGPNNYEGQLAVMSVITNRVDARYSGASDVWQVITAPGQFEAYGAGHHWKHAGNVTETTRAAVADGLSGVKTVSTLNFWSAAYAAQQGRSGVNIGGNVFFNF